MTGVTGLRIGCKSSADRPRGIAAARLGAAVCGASAGGLILSAALGYNAGLFMLCLREFFTFAGK